MIFSFFSMLVEFEGQFAVERRFFCIVLTSRADIDSRKALVGKGIARVDDTKLDLPVVFFFEFRNSQFRAVGNREFLVHSCRYEVRFVIKKILQRFQTDAPPVCKAAF